MLVMYTMIDTESLINTQLSSTKEYWTNVWT